jgi:hypothetical protein
MEMAGVDFKLFWKKGRRSERGGETGDWVLNVEGVSWGTVTTVPVCDNPYKLVASLNAHRRHLTPEIKRELIKKLLKLRPEKSNRSIAKEADTHHHAVEKVRQDEERRGNISHVEARTDSTGRKQPATKPAAKTTVKPESKKPKANPESFEQSEEVYQETLFDQACQLTEHMSDKTRQEFFANTLQHYSKEAPQPDSVEDDDGSRVSELQRLNIALTSQVEELTELVAVKDAEIAALKGKAPVPTADANERAERALTPR